MVWYRLYTDITPPPFIGLSHDFLPILKSKKTSHSYTPLTVSSLSPELPKKEKLHPPRILFAHKYVRGRYGTTRKVRQESKLMTQ